VIRTKPDFTCVDNGNTTFFIPGHNPDSDGWPNFNGTSAAASHAAALAALIKQVKPSSTPQEVYAAIVNNTIDMETPGFDYLTGYGLCDATAALASIEFPNISLSVTPSPLTLPEPGGDVVFGITVSNIGDIDVTLTELSDDTVGNLDGLGNCSVPHSLVASTGSYSCSYTLAVLGNAGDVVVHEIAATVEDNELNELNFRDSAVVTITDVLPTATLVASANPSELAEPGGAATISITIENTGDAESITVTSLSASQTGDLNGQGTCATPQSISPGATYECEFSSNFVGTIGTKIVRQISGSAEDDELNTVDVADDISVLISSTDIIFRDGFESN
jgi:subtilisin family serine protease